MHIELLKLNNKEKDWLKMAKDLNRHFAKENMETADNHVGR